MHSPGKSHYTAIPEPKEADEAPLRSNPTQLTGKTTGRNLSGPCRWLARLLHLLGVTLLLAFLPMTVAAECPYCGALTLPVQLLGFTLVDAVRGITSTTRNSFRTKSVFWVLLGTAAVSSVLYTIFITHDDFAKVHDIVYEPPTTFRDVDVLLLLSAVCVLIVHTLCTVSFAEGNASGRLRWVALVLFWPAVILVWLESRDKVGGERQGSHAIRTVIANSLGSMASVLSAVFELLTCARQRRIPTAWERVPKVIAHLPDEILIPETQLWEPSKLSPVFQNKTAVVFGATGSCGHGFVSALLDAGCKVTAVVRSSPDFSTFPKGAEISVGNISDPKYLRSTLESRPDFVFSGLASRSGLDDSAWELYELHCNVFRASAEVGVGCVVIVTSFCGAIACELPIHQPLLNTERALIDMKGDGDRGQPDYLIIRPTSFYENFLRRAIPEMLEGRPVKVILPERGPLRHMFLAAKDVARFALIQLAKNVRNTTLQVGGTRARTFEEVVHIIGEVAEVDVSVKRVSMSCFDRLIAFMTCLDAFKGTHVSHYMKFGKYFNTVPMQCSTAFTTISLQEWAKEQLPHARSSKKLMV